MRYVNGLNFNQKGNLLTSVANDLDVVFWDWAVRKKRDCFMSGHSKNIFHVCTNN